MDYITTAQAAQKWGISANRVFKLIRAGRIPDAVKVGTIWMIPESIEKPVDGRSRAGKAAAAEAAGATHFRYLSFVEHRDPSSFNPPLTPDELQLKAVIEAFHACRFEEADELLADLPQRAQDRYCRISALYEACMLDLALCRVDRFTRQYGLLLEETQGDFPHSKEMREFAHLLDSSLGNDSYYIRTFQVDPAYHYHESFLPRLAMLTTLSFGSAEASPSIADLGVYETNCKLLEDRHAYDDLQTIHLYLGTAYSLVEAREQAKCHFVEALKLAQEHELYFNVSGHYYYWKQFYEPALLLFENGFRERIEHLSEDGHARYVRFMEKASLNAIYKLLLGGDYILLHYALRGYTSKEVAKVIHVSASTVNKRYSNLYAALGLKSKRELHDFYRNLTSNPVLGTSNPSLE